MDDDEAVAPLAPAHVGLPPVESYGYPPSTAPPDRVRATPHCERCGAVAWRLFNVGEYRYEFMCLEDTCRMRWWVKKGRMGPL